MRRVTTNPAQARIRSQRRLLLRGVLAGGAIIALAACGSSGSSSSSKPSSSSSSSSPASVAAVKTSTNSKFGNILVDGSGRTVYTLTNGGAAVACTGQCLAFWPPVIAPAASSTVTAAGVSSLGTIAGPGGKQITYRALPLYTFANDKAPGDATGDGVSSFGGTWQVVKIGGASSGSTSGGGVVSTTTTTKAKGGSGY